MRVLLQPLMQEAREWEPEGRNGVVSGRAR